MLLVAPRVLANFHLLFVLEGVPRARNAMLYPRRSAAEQFARFKNRPHAQDNNKSDRKNGTKKNRDTGTRNCHTGSQDQAEVRKITRYGNVDLYACLQRQHMRLKVKHYAPGPVVAFEMRCLGDGDVDNASQRGKAVGVEISYWVIFASPPGPESKMPHRNIG